MHAQQYFALIHLNLKLSFCANNSFFLLLVLLDTRHHLHVAPVILAAPGPSSAGHGEAEAAH